MTDDRLCGAGARTAPDALVPFLFATAWTSQVAAIVFFLTWFLFGPSGGSPQRFVASLAAALVGSGATMGWFTLRIRQAMRRSSEDRTGVEDAPRVSFRFAAGFFLALLMFPSGLIILEGQRWQEPKMESVRDLSTAHCNWALPAPPFLGIEWPR
jgi:hypothetical protein